MRSRGVSSYRSNKRSKRGNKLRKRLSKRRVKGGWMCDTEREEIAALRRDITTLNEKLRISEGTYNRLQTRYSELQDSIIKLFDRPINKDKLVSGGKYVMQDGNGNYFLIKILDMEHRFASRMVIYEYLNRNKNNRRGRLL